MIVGWRKAGEKIEIILMCKVGWVFSSKQCQWLPYITYRTLDLPT